MHRRLFFSLAFAFALNAACAADFAAFITATRDRLTAENGAEAYARATPAEIFARLTAAERDTLATGFVRFELSAPAMVHVIIPAVKNDDPFWLRANGFTRSGADDWTIGGGTYETWSRHYNAGLVGLGAPSLSAEPDVYSVVITPGATAAPDRPAPQITNLAPVSLKIAKVTPNAVFYADSGRRAEKIPARFHGATLIRCPNNRKQDARLFRVYRLTGNPSTPRPDQIMLTWTGDSSATQTIRWRTSTTITRGHVTYATGTFSTSTAESLVTVLSTPDVANDPVEHLHTVALRDLAPATTYTYTINDDQQTRAAFTTAPAQPQPFSFLYLGDAQNGFKDWGRLVRCAIAARPAAAFCLMAGDQVNRGEERDNWDAFFAQAATIFNRIPLAPAPGNHEYHGGAPRLYSRLFATRANGPETIGPGLAYSFHYAGALFVVLDGNTGVKKQAPWLEQQLRDTSARWKFVMYHQPAYAARPGRFYPEINEHWVPLFDKYHVDVAFQGHDHSYLRTPPMRGGKPAASAREGTIYIISVSGTKFYPQGPHLYTLVGFQDTPTWQIVDLDPVQNRLRYRACDAAGKLRDEFSIEK